MRDGVYLVGAGPGDPDLITVRGKALLEQADVVVYDHLANPVLLNYTKVECQHIYVGKKAGHHSMAQQDINQLLIRLSRQNKIVVRLKGGDPYVFGRGGEEGEVLHKAAVPFEVVPGISSAIGGLAYAGIPITYRQEAGSFHVVTGHLSSDEEIVNLAPLAQVKGTLVFLMGVKNLSRLVEGLLINGKDPQTPVAIVYRASTAQQRVTEGLLSTIVALAEKEAIRPPSLIVVGEVVKHRAALNFFERRPLTGSHILVTRAKQNQSKMAKALRALGAKVTQIPAVKIEPINRDLLIKSIAQISHYQGLIFTSGVTVTLFFETLAALQLDARALHAIKIYALGAETAKVLRKSGIVVDFIPEHYSKEHLRELLLAVAHKDDRFLMPRSARADRAWLSQLQQDFKIDEVKCYDTLNQSTIAIDPTTLGKVDYITFTSGSTVEGYMHLTALDQTGVLKEILETAKLVAIGPTTRSYLTAHGLQAALQPDRYTIDDMIATICRDRQAGKE